MTIHFGETESHDLIKQSKLKKNKAKKYCFLNCAPNKPHSLL